MTLDFLSPVPDGDVPAAESPLEPWQRAAGARFAERDGWRIAVAFDAPEEGEVVICDRSSMGKFELQGRPEALAAALQQLGGEPEPGGTVELEEGLLWRPSPDRALVLCERAATARTRPELAELAELGCALVELTAGFAAFELRGPRAGDLLARLTTIDVRPQALGVGEIRPGVIAHVAATLLRVEADAFVLLVHAPEALDAWEIVLDAGEPLGLRAVGEEARSRA